MKIKVIYIVSDIDKSMHFEWITPLLNINFEVSYILIGQKDTALEQFLRSQNIQVFIIPYSHNGGLVRVWLRVFKILRVQKPDIIHAHLWIANLVGLTAGWLAGVKKRIYTRHHATLHYKEYPSGLKWDKLNNRLATHIIAISRNVEDILINWDNAERKKITLIPHGFEFSYFMKVDDRRVRYLSEKYNLKIGHRPVIGVISRFIEWKGIQFIIPAFARLREEFPNAHLILANAHGDYERELGALLSFLPVSSYTRIKFENDLAALYKLFDIFVHVPFDERSEAFGQTYVEPLIAGIPCVFTLSGIAREFITNEQNALVVDYKNEVQIYDGLQRLLKDDMLRTSIIENARKSVEAFAISKYAVQLEKLYLA